MSALDPITGYADILRKAADLLTSGGFDWGMPNRSSLPDEVFGLAYCEAAAIRQACRALETEGSLDPHAVALLREGSMRDTTDNRMVAAACIDAYAHIVWTCVGLTAKTWDRSAEDPKRDCELTACANLRFAAKAMAEQASVSAPWRKGGKIVQVMKHG